MDSPKAHAEMEDDIKRRPLVELTGTSEADQKLTRKILFKLDTRILPILAILFLCSFLDRTNVGNAKILGLEEDLGITNNQYDIGLAVFYLFYVLR